jgi:copper chaperone CopZ
MTLQLKIPSIACSGCVDTITKAVQKLDADAIVNADTQTKKDSPITIAFPIPNLKFMAVFSYYSALVLTEAALDFHPFGAALGAKCYLNYSKLAKRRRFDLAALICATSHQALVSRLTPRLLWENVLPHLQTSVDGYLVFDDTVLDKRYAQKIELVRRMYSGTEHRVIRGIGVVTCLYVLQAYWTILGYKKPAQICPT